VLRSGADLLIRPSGATKAGVALPAAFCIPLEVPGDLRLPYDRGTLTARIVPRGELSRLPGEKTRVALDADVLGGLVTIRTRLAGDTFQPLGAPGHRKLKEFLIDCKVPRQQRDRIPLVVGPTGIAWVVGHRIGHGYRVLDTTRLVAVLEYIGQVDLTVLPHYYKGGGGRRPDTETTS
jgi:tRNA(Ile)-lysidine synthase